MSHTEMYVVRPDGEVMSYAKFANSHGGAMAVWTLLSEKHLGVTGVEFMMMLSGDLKELFQLQKDGKLEPWEDIVLTTTCDSVVVPIEHVETVAIAMEKFAETYGPHQAAKNYVFSIGEQATKLRQIFAEREEHGWRGVCWNQSSVSCPLWSGKGVELSEDDPHYGDPEYDQEEHHPYNVDEHEEHWFYEPPKAENHATVPEPSKEAVYDEQISPLMTQILAICKERRINMAATFALDACQDEESEQFGEPLWCTSVLALDLSDGGGSATVKKIQAVVRDGWEVQPPFAMAMTLVSRDSRGSDPK